MAIFRNKRRSEFVQVPNDFIGNPAISGNGKAILIYLWSKSHDWSVYARDIVKHMKEGRDSVYRTIRELIDLGYIHRKRRRLGANGRFRGYHYDVYGKPFEWLDGADGVDALSMLASHELSGEETVQ